MNKYFFAGLILSIIIAAAIFESRMAQPDLATFVRINGRQVIAPGQKQDNPDYHRINLRNLIDGDPDTSILLKHPANLPESTYILVDLGLTHWARRINEKAPTTRKANKIQIINGSCQRCPSDRFKQTARLKKIRIDLLYRQANNVDKEYEFPPVRVVSSKTVEINDSQDTIQVDLSEISPPKSSQRWPENMFYIIAKVVILDLYPGTIDNRVAIAELIYLDQPVRGFIE